MRRDSDAPPRIVSLAPSVTSILCGIGARGMLAGVSKWCADVAPVAGLPKFGDFWQLEEVAAIHALKPDLVIGSVPFRAEALAKLLEYPLNFLAIHPQSLAGIERDIRQLGALAGRAEAAEKLIEKMRKEFAAVAKRSAGKRRLRVYCEAWPNPRIASPPWVAELCAMAGAEFVPRAGARVTNEEVAQAEPEAIVLAWTAMGKNAKVRTAYGVAEWKDVPAIRERRVFAVRDELLNTPGPPLMEGVRELERIFERVRKGQGAR